MELENLDRTFEESGKYFGGYSASKLIVINLIAGAWANQVCPAILPFHFCCMHPVVREIHFSSRRKV